MKFRFLKTSLIGLILSANCFVGVSHAGIITLGDTLSGGVVDSWQSIMIINEYDAYTNTSGADELVTLNNFNFTVGNNRGQVTPFVVKINNAASNDFTIMAIGDTRYSGVDYFSTGNLSLDFSTTLSQFSLAAGETITSGFLDADVNGVSAGSVIPYIGGDPVFLTGGGSNNHSGNLSQGVGNAPTFGSSTYYNGLARNYSYNITAEINAVPEPTSLAIFAMGLIGLVSLRSKKQA
ncbi:PEP-CTERM sorting domain-containing protein [Psychrosphaera sp. 1_MG-2023]|uniref:PEP-CTERM sorting domain-containing protein n=1 Tax=Psychrosphaera sp. 1_MG-2023 TaxID=3062643 RepID=UPI0026E12EF8|nr:PEP-CTERM sorting domain-containing protein [Psychrosphaera sp. 1_MG-2023]MDO6719274.1 PEP-CTERM sorting domain-containing protein [Psychrosphaera sp. 1_MG-2023]